MRASALGRARAQPHCRERRLDDVARAQVLLVLGRKIEERQELVLVAAQRVHGLRILGTVFGLERSDALLGWPKARIDELLPDAWAELHRDAAEAAVVAELAALQKSTANQPAAADSS